jgi:hypothetical protein
MLRARMLPHAVPHQAPLAALQVICYGTVTAGIILESAVEHGFVGNPGVSGKASFAVNGYSLNKNDNAAGCVGIFHKFL